MYSVRDDAALPAPGCPIRESAVQRLFNTSSRLIAVVHALHRLLMPRHPPCALTILTVILLCRPPTWRPPGGRHSGRNLQHEVTDFGLQMDLPIRARDLDPELGQLCSFQGPAKGATAGDSRGRSLKTQQHVCASVCAFRTGSVDMLRTFWSVGKDSARC